MEMFEPYPMFRWTVAILFAGCLFYDLFDLAVWYRQLPRWVQRIVLLKLLQLRSRALKVELSLTVALFLLQGWLTVLLLRG